MPTLTLRASCPWSQPFLWLGPECCFGIAQLCSGHLVDASAADLVIWFPWRFSMLVGNEVEPGTWPRVKPMQALRAARRSGQQRWLSTLLKRPPLLGWALLLFQPGCAHPPTSQPWRGRGQGQRLTVVCLLIMASEGLQQHIPDQWCLSGRQAPAWRTEPQPGVAKSCLLRPRPGSLWVEWGLNPCRELCEP